jgi:uncharacterized protein (DUF433 family)
LPPWSTTSEAKNIRPVKGTRILADGVIVNADSGISPEEIANDLFPGLGVERARRLIAFARQHAQHLV